MSVSLSQLCRGLLSGASSSESSTAYVLWRLLGAFCVGPRFLLWSAGSIYIMLPIWRLYLAYNIKMKLTFQHGFSIPQSSGSGLQQEQQLVVLPFYHCHAWFMKTAVIGSLESFPVSIHALIAWFFGKVMCNHWDQWTVSVIRYIKNSLSDMSL